MELKDKNRYKAEFKKELDKFADKLEKYVSTENGDWTVKGFIDIYKNIYTISSDTKIVSKILEIHIFPQILQFAESIDYKIILAEKQNWYPDLTFVNKRNEAIKFALDIKRLLDGTIKQQVLLWVVMVAISKKEIKTKIFNFHTINIRHIFVWVSYTQEQMYRTTFQKLKFIKFKTFKNKVKPQ